MFEEFFFLFIYTCYEFMEKIEGKKKKDKFFIFFSMHVMNVWKGYREKGKCTFNEFFFFFFLGLFMYATMCEKGVNVMHVAMNDVEKGNS